MIKINALDAIAMHCLECVGDWESVFSCEEDGHKGIKCYFYDLRPLRQHNKLQKVFFTEDLSRTSVIFTVNKRVKT